MRSSAWVVTVLRSTALTVALATVHRRIPRGRAPAPGRRLLAPGLAIMGPLATIAYAVRYRDGRCALPPSSAARVLLAAHALTGAAAEELLWRGPLVHLRSRRARLVAALGGGVGFVAVHLPRDGARGLPIHAVNTAAWTAAALTGKEIRWSVLAHAGYNIAAIVLRGPGDDLGGAA